MEKDKKSTDGGSSVNRKKIIILMAVAVLLVLISVGATLFFVKSSSSDNAASVDAELKKPAIYHSLQPAFVVNYVVNGRQRFLQTDISLLIRDTAVGNALDLHAPAIRNSLVLLLSAQDYEALQTAEGKQLLRDDALKAVQELLQQEIGKPGVEQLLFTSFVMQ